MRKSFLYILTGALLLSSLCAQARKGHRLGRYGIVPGGYSGITALGDDRYAVVSDRDKQAGFHVWHIVLNPQTGALEDVCEESFRAQEGNMERDAEGVAYCPARQSVFVSGEADGAILEHRLDGTLTGAHLAVPAQVVTSLASNRGFESLTYDSVHHHFWTMNESPLLIEGDAQRLLLMQFDDQLRLSASFPYHMQAPSPRIQVETIIMVCRLWQPFLMADSWCLSARLALPGIIRGASAGAAFSISLPLRVKSSWWDNGTAGSGCSIHVLPITKESVWGLVCRMAGLP